MSTIVSLSKTIEVLNGVFGNGNKGDLWPFQKGGFVERL